MRTVSAKVRLASMAARQCGRVSRAQLLGAGLSDAGIAHGLERGYLHRVLPGVYAIGHNAADPAADLAAALLYAGPGAMLSHHTAAWWLGLIDGRPSRITVSTSRRCRSLRRLRVYERRRCERIWHGGFPVTTIAQTMLDISARSPLRVVRKALAQAEYRGLLDFDAVSEILGRGKPGSVRLRTALVHHQPRLAATKSELELQFLELCEASGIPLPEVNQRVLGWEVDVLWREERLASSSTGSATITHPPRSSATARRTWSCARVAGRSFATRASS